MSTENKYETLEKIGMFPIHKFTLPLLADIHGLSSPLNHPRR